MEDKTLFRYLSHGYGALAGFAFFAFILPLLAAYTARQSLHVTLALMGSAFVIEYGAAPVGIVGGLDPLFVLFVLSGIAFGVTLLLFGFCGSLKEHWPRFARFVERTRDRAQNSAILARYGIFGLVPLVIILGFYFCAPAACIFGWRRDHAAILIMAGYIPACILTILATQGFIGTFVP